MAYLDPRFQTVINFQLGQDPLHAHSVIVNKIQFLTDC